MKSYDVVFTLLSGEGREEQFLALLVLWFPRLSAGKLESVFFRSSRSRCLVKVRSLEVMIQKSSSSKPTSSCRKVVMSAAIYGKAVSWRLGMCCCGQE
jgi:hypothetical protein